MSCPWVRFRQSRAESSPVCTDVSACTVSHWAPSCKAAGERSTPAAACQPRSSRAVPRLRTWAAQAMSSCGPSLSGARVSLAKGVNRATLLDLRGRGRFRRAPWCAPPLRRALRVLASRRPCADESTESPARAALRCLTFPAEARYQPGVCLFQFFRKTQWAGTPPTCASLHDSPRLGPCRRAISAMWGERPCERGCIRARKM